MKKFGFNVLDLLAMALLSISLSGCDNKEGGDSEHVGAALELSKSNLDQSSRAYSPLEPEIKVQSDSDQAGFPIILSNDMSGLINIAKGKLVEQSSTYKSPDNFEAVAGLAVDGNVDGIFLHHSISLTNKDKNAWWEVDLGALEKINHIAVWNRTECCSNSWLKNYWIFVSEKPFLPNSTADDIKKDKHVIAINGGAANPVFVSPSPIGSGRYVRIQLDGADREDSMLQLAEVEIYRAK